MARFVLSSLVCLLLASMTFGQSVPTSDPQALVLASESVAALTAGNAVADATVTANVTRFAGSDTETGTVVMQARAPSQSRLDFTLSDGARSEIRDSSTGGPLGAWIDSKATATRYATQNCWTEPVWFFPALSFLSFANNPTLVLSYVGKETWNGLSVQHLHAFWVEPKGMTSKLFDVQRFSAADVYLDAVTLLPDALTFKAHPDNGADVDIPIEVRFGDYRLVSGVQVPFRIQKLLNGTLLLDLTGTTAVINSGIPSSTFSIQ